MSGNCRQMLVTIALAGLLALPGSALAKTWSGEMTLPGAIDAALVNNSGFLGQQLTVEARESDLAEARGRTGPNAKATVSETTKRIEESYGPEMVITLSQSVQAFHPLLDTPKYPVPMTTTQLADVSVRQSRAKLDKARTDLIYSVSQAYYAILKAKGLVEVQESGVKAAEAAREDAKLKLDSGTGTKVDVLRAELEVANSRVALDKARNAVTQRQAEFYALIGVEPPPGEIEFAMPQPVADVTTSLEDLVKGATQKRADLLDARLNVDRATSAVNDARRGQLPTLSVSTTYSEEHGEAQASWEPLSGKAGWNLTVQPTDTLPSSRLGSGSGGSSESEWVSGLNLSYPLFDSGVQKEVVRQAELDLKQSQLSYSQAVAQASNEVLTAYLALNEARSSLSALQQALDQAQETRRLTDLRVKNGVGTTSELIDANRDLVKAQTDLTQAKFDYQLAVLRLRKAANLD